jgi:HAE1 family hydrophobic/amphiphilic exporter-1
MFELIVRRPVGVTMLTVAASLFGVLSYQQRPVSLMPPLSFPSLTVQTRYPGAAPEEVEAELTEPVEGRLSTVEGLRALRSRSAAGLSEVQLELRWGVNLDGALQRVYERLDQLRLPKGVDPPQVLRYDPTLEPIMELALTLGGDRGAGLSLAEVRRYAEEVLTPSVHQVEGVAAVRVVGGDVARVEVELHGEALRRHRLTPSQVSDALRAAHVNIAGGRLHTEGGELLVRTVAQLADLDALHNTLIVEREGAWLRLKDVATARLGVEERAAWVQVGEEEAVRVQIYRQSDANLVEVARRLRAALFDVPPEDPALRAPAALPLRPQHPKGLRAYLTSDQARFIEDALSSVQGAIWSGGLLAVIVLFLFLGSLYQTVVVALSIPLSVVLSFIPLQLFDVSLNLMSLGGLALGVGMLVDNAVVVLEAIARRREEGEAPLEAAARGAAEVGGAVVASTLTTVAVFAPVAFIEGLAGQVFRDLALTVVSALLASLAVALAVVPTLAAREPALEARPSPQRPLGLLPLNQLRLWREGLRGRPSRLLLAPLTLPFALIEWGACLTANLSLLALVALIAALRLPWWLLNRLIGAPARGLSRGVMWTLLRVEDAYSATLRGALRAPALPIALTLALAAWAWTLTPEVPRALLPEVSQGTLIAEVDLPVGTSLPETQRRLSRWTRALSADERVRRVEMVIGQDDAEGQSGEERGPHQARLALSLAARGLEEPIGDTLRALAAQEPGATLRLSRPSLLTVKPPIRVALRAHSLSALREAERRVYEALKPLEGEGLSDLRRSAREGYPEIQIRYDYARLAHIGLSPLAVAEQVRAQLTGEEALEVRWGGAQLPIIVRAEGATALTAERLSTLLISPATPALSTVAAVSAPREPLPLAALADLAPGEGPAEVRHLDGQRAAEITAHASAFELGARAEQVERALADITLPHGVDLRRGGQESDMTESSAQLSAALLISLFLVFVVMATQFESLMAPLLIMGAVPLAAIGVVVGLWWTQTPLSVVVFVGLITLSGVVVNNAIILIDAAQRRRADLTLDDALVSAGRTRLRPILMTTLTTLIGLIPMLSPNGEGAELRAPLALTLIFGLSASTLLVLLVLPTLARLARLQR